MLEPDIRGFADQLRLQNQDGDHNIPNSHEASSTFRSEKDEATDSFQPIVSNGERNSIELANLDAQVHDPTFAQISLIEKNDPEVERDRWGSGLMFILSAMGAAVGLGNIWRFPHLVYTHGGGAFLLPYFGALALFGLPLLLLEFSLGQQTQKAAMQAFSVVHRRAGGVGLASALGAYIMAAYYSVLLAW
jgi:hypothetical protein